MKQQSNMSGNERNKIKKTIWPDDDDDVVVIIKWAKLQIIRCTKCWSWTKQCSLYIFSEKMTYYIRRNGNGTIRAIAAYTFFYQKCLCLAIGFDQHHDNKIGATIVYWLTLQYPLALSVLRNYNGTELFF